MNAQTYHHGQPFVYPHTQEIYLDDDQGDAVAYTDSDYFIEKKLKDRKVHEDHESVGMDTFGEPNIIFLFKYLKDLCGVLILASSITFAASLFFSRPDLTLSGAIGIFAFTFAFTTARSILHKLRNILKSFKQSA